MQFRAKLPGRRSDFPLSRAGSGELQQLTKQAGSKDQKILFHVLPLAGNSEMQQLYDSCVSRMPMAKCKT